jgi:UDPglucose 6-dehydrogenase
VEPQVTEPVSICVIGSGYVGLVAAACFAEMGHRVLCVDNDEARVKTLCGGGVPIFERHLPELLAKHRDRGLSFTTDLASAVEQSAAGQAPKHCNLASFSPGRFSLMHTGLELDI